MRPKSGNTEHMSSASSLTKKSLKDIQRNLRDLVADIESGNLNGEESKQQPSQTNSEYYSSKYFKPPQFKILADRKNSDQGFLQMNMDSMALKFNRRASGYGTQTNHMLLIGE